MANGTIHTFGTLKIGDITYGRPSVPEENGGCIEWVKLRGMPNISISIENTIQGEELRWIELIKKDGKKLLVCDRCLIVRVDWGVLDKQGLIFGKRVTIDGKEYWLRSLRGSSGEFIGSGNDNEWDNLIDAVGEYNDITHWRNMYTFCLESNHIHTSMKTIRGFASPRSYAMVETWTRSSRVGWRPVLEVLNSAPTISGTDTDLGTITKEPSYSYTLSDSDNDNVTVTEKLDGKTLRTLTNGENLGGGGHYITPMTNG